MCLARRLDLECPRWRPARLRLRRRRIQQPPEGLRESREMKCKNQHKTAKECSLSEHDDPPRSWDFDSRQFSWVQNAWGGPLSTSCGMTCQAETDSRNRQQKLQQKLQQ